MAELNFGSESSSPHYVQSVLDTDLYKLTMQQAVQRHFPDKYVKYKFTNRNRSMKFTRACVAAIEEAIDKLGEIKLEDNELQWLKAACPYFQPGYLEYLWAFRFKPKEQITLRFVPQPNEGDAVDHEEVGDIEIEVNGLWAEVILYETPVMAVVSEAYFVHVDKDWTMDGQEELAYEKGKELYEGGVLLSEFGARRRRSYAAQNAVMKGLVRADKSRPEGVKGKLSGTSNVHLARKYNTKPIGTIAHEWTMALGAMYGVEKANLLALELWEKVYPTHTSNELHIALTDTYTSEAFFKDVAQTPGLLAGWRGVRQDSGDPFKFIGLAKRAYEGMGVDPKEKLIIFSDSLNNEKCLALKKACDEVGIPAGFGVGTSLTNDFKSKMSGEKSKPLNIVIKVASINGLDCVKISDDIMKVAISAACQIITSVQVNVEGAGLLVDRVNAVMLVVTTPLGGRKDAFEVARRATGVWETKQGRLADSRVAAEEACGEFQRLGLAPEAAEFLQISRDMDLLDGQPDDCRCALEEAQGEFERMGMQKGTAGCLTSLGEINLRAGRHDEGIGRGATDIREDGDKSVTGSMRIFTCGSFQGCGGLRAVMGVRSRFVLSMFLL
ncbi:nicotinate phosphoribosyltransferase [Tulasnella sp. 331]|nr:nicotinate phosphoribosyltransferase [Tulasnella sp. 331]